MLFVACWLSVCCSCVLCGVFLFLFVGGCCMFFLMVNAWCWPLVVSGWLPSDVYVDCRLSLTFVCWILLLVVVVTKSVLCFRCCVFVAFVCLMWVVLCCVLLVGCWQLRVVCC